MRNSAMMPTSTTPTPNSAPPAPTGKPAILLLENDVDVLSDLKFQLERRTTLDVHAARGIKEAMDIVNNAGIDLQAAVVDIKLDGPVGQTKKNLEPYGPPVFEKWGHSFAGWLRAQQPVLPIYGITGDLKSPSSICNEWFSDNGKTPWSVHIYDKYTQFKFLKHHLLLQVGLKSEIQVFVVYGHDETSRKQLEAKLHSLGWKFIVLGGLERNNHSWFDMIELHASDCHLAIILYTADENATPYKPELNAEKRPRPNVLLEHGYFLGRYGRKSKRVFLLHHQSVSLPSDIENSGGQLIKTTINDAWPEILVQLDPWLTAAQRVKASP